MIYLGPVNPGALTDDEAIRAIAIRMSLELDVNVDLAEAAVRNLIARGLIERNEARISVDGVFHRIGKTQKHPALWQAIYKMGTLSRLARALGITPQAVGRWHRVPHRRVLDVERVTGIHRSAICPEVYPPAPERKNGRR